MTSDVQSAGQKVRMIDRALGRSGEFTVADLYKRARVGENIIRGLLLFCGIVSIFTTIGIVVVLGRESLLFFGSEAWLPSKTLAVVDQASGVTLRETVSVNDSFFPTGEMDAETRSEFLPGRFLRVDSEIMGISERTPDGLIVRRGQEGTVAEAHDEGTTAFPLEEVLVKVAAPVTATSESVQLQTGHGLGFEAGDRIRIGAEVMRVIDGTFSSVEVERGFDGTNASPHRVDENVEFPKRVTLGEFVTNTTWQPQIGEFGILPLVNSTLMTSTIAMLVAIPLGLGAAIYLSEYAHPRTRGILKPILEVLAGVPTVVYGYFAIQFMTPLLRTLLNDTTGREIVQIYNVASAGIVMGVMILPTISSMSEDAMSAVPRALREASYGLGSTRLETTLRVVFPAALSGIVAAFIVGISRAVGETMIVAIAAGAVPNFTFNPFVSAETMTGHIARISSGDLSYNSIDYNSIFAIGMTLFTITLILNLISSYIARRFREAY